VPRGGVFPGFLTAAASAPAARDPRRPGRGVRIASPSFHAPPTPRRRSGTRSGPCGRNAP